HLPWVPPSPRFLQPLRHEHACFEHPLHIPHEAFVLNLTFRTLFSRSMMVFEECPLAKRGMVLSHPTSARRFAPAGHHHTDGEAHEPARGYSRGAASPRRNSFSLSVYPTRRCQPGDC